jgi:hypothetical protein
MNDIATHFLQTYAAGGEVAEGWKYGKALQQARLDYSPESLARLDQLLAQVRERAKPTRADLDSVQGRNFTALIMFYLIEVARRRTGADIVWQDRATASRVVPKGTQLPNALFTRLVANALDQGAMFFPLGWLEAQLLPDGKQFGTADYIADMVSRIERDGPAVWWQAAHAMGSMASWQMMMAADGGSVLPMMLSQKAPKTWVRLMSGFLQGEDVAKALEHGDRQLEGNPEGSTWQVLSYDGVIDEKGERIDAVMVIAYSYGKQPLRMKVAFPYRPALAGRRFAILQPALRDANIANEKISLLNSALERGIQSVKWAFGTTWNELREP